MSGCRQALGRRQPPAARRVKPRTLGLAFETSRSPVLQGYSGQGSRVATGPLPAVETTRPAWRERSRDSNAAGALRPDPPPDNRPDQRARWAAPATPDCRHRSAALRLGERVSAIIQWRQCLIIARTISETPKHTKEFRGTAHPLAEVFEWPRRPDRTAGSPGLGAPAAGLGAGSSAGCDQPHTTRSEDRVLRTGASFRHARPAHDTAGPPPALACHASLRPTVHFNQARSEDPSRRTLLGATPRRPLPRPSR